VHSGVRLSRRYASALGFSPSWKKEMIWPSGSRKAAYQPPGASDTGVTISIPAPASRSIKVSSPPSGKLNTTPGVLPGFGPLSFYGVAASDAATFLVTAFGLAAAALLASYVPARRAVRVDPLVTLRQE
jgi:hypothetical protein